MLEYNPATSQLNPNHPHHMHNRTWSPLASGHTAVCVAVDRQLAAAVSVSDTVRFAVPGLSECVGCEQYGVYIHRSMHVSMYTCVCVCVCV